MRTFKVLAGGWLIGGLFIVLLGGDLRAARKEDRAARVAREHSVQRQTGPRAAGAMPVGRTPAFGTSGILIPVVGITPQNLKDTFSQARGGGRTHRAIDILAPQGTPVVAAVDGTIRKLFFSKSGGITIYQFDRAEEHNYYYAHLDRYADGIAEGQFVPQGTVIGYVGVTGNAPPGTPHLHFSIEVLPPTKEWSKGQPVNPYPLLVGAATTRASMLP
ncbi:MAG TPA: M23 family metallopeptidase [Thermoanaerobaculia bacterium]|nr:M23 family metallopeptidase [Thermoanaerobaculia bacterium]